MTQESYVSRASRLLKDFDTSVSRVEHLLVARYGEEEAHALVRESRQRYRDVIPQIPYIGRRDPMLIFLLPTTRYLAIYKTFQAHGRTLEEAGRLAYEIGEAEIAALPGWVRRAIGILWFSRWLTKGLQRKEASSHERRYPGASVIAYVEGDGQDFDYGVDYVECAVCKFLGQQDAAELAPYACAVDRPASEMLGWGLRRTTTLAEGGPRCDFRFKKGGETRVSIPQSLTLTFESNAA
jgi:hypothetical protein